MERAPEPVDAVFRPCDPLSSPASDLLGSMVAELIEMYSIVEGPIGVPLDDSELGPPDGVYLVGWVGESPVAGGGFRTIGEATGEIKRMYVHPEWRGRGLGALLLGALEEAATGLGLRKVRLDTGPRQPAAQRLYERSGYVAIANYNANPHATYWGEKVLGDR